MKYPSGRRRRPAADDDDDEGPAWNDHKRQRHQRRRGRSARGYDGEIDVPSDDDDEDLAGGKDAAAWVAADETVPWDSRRAAKERLEEMRARADADLEEDGDVLGKEEREGRRDSLVSERLRRAQEEESGRSRRSLACRVLKPGPQEKFELYARHRKSATAVALQEDESRGFSASRDGAIAHWDVETRQVEKYLWPREDVLIAHGAKAQDSSRKRSNWVLGLAVSADNRYLASGGCDRHVHLWDIRTRAHIQAFPGHRDRVSCVAFKSGSSLLFSGSFDRTIKMWNSEDRTFLGSLFGHQSDILTMDCTWNLERECLLTAGRDRTMRLYKVHDETQLVFRTHASSLESCCMINASEYISGSDDGSIELWSNKHKKPTCIIKNAHAPILSSESNLNRKQDVDVSNGNIEANGTCEVVGTSAANSWVSAIAVCRGSDLAASGAANGVVRLWAIGSENRSLQPLFYYPEAGFINSLAFAKSGRFLAAAVGQEHRLGRWGHVGAARNGVVLHHIRLSD